MKIDVVLHGDCRTMMKTIPSSSIHLVFTDPPYNLSSKSKLTFIRRDDNGNNRIRTTEQAWGKKFKDKYTKEEIIDLMGRLAEESYRLLIDGGSIVTFYDHENSHYYLPRFYEVGFTRANTFIFAKNNPLPHVRKNNYRSAFEEAAWFVKGVSPGSRFNWLGQSKMKNVIRGNIGSVGGKKTEHPTEKYRWMADPVILAHSRPGDIILDPFCGSGTFLESACEYGRHYVGMEIEEQLYNECTMRLKNAKPKTTREMQTKQHTLF